MTSKDLKMNNTKKQVFAYCVTSLESSKKSNQKHFHSYDILTGSV